ncbi:MAG: YraN family protein [Candidatus Wildermuthbacteria bacterium]|nr:YraN family protein [Candidatus Wildermuthbacteria bacterium]
MEKLDVGRLGEKLASEYLRKQGYTILAQNYRTRYAEIDLIAKQKDVLVIVEVRTKVGEQFGTPEETLNYKKLQKVRRNAEAYVAYGKWKGPCRIDAVCIVLAEDYTPQRIEHHENI